MSTSDANRSSSSPVLYPPERSEIALSAVICSYNRYDLLPAAIESLVKQDLPADSFEIIVVDNSPDQAGAARFGQRYAGLSNLTYLVEPKPGLSNARNKGTAAALGRIVAFIDDDARACASWAKELLHAHAAFDGRAGIVGGPIVPCWADEKPAWIGKPLLGYLSVVDLGHELRELSAGEWLAGCNISFDRASLIATGGFSTRLGRMGSGSTLLSNDDLEASERVRAMGKLVIYTPKAVVEHVIPPERLTQSWFRRRAAWQAVSDLLSEPELAPDLAAIALQRLSRRSYRSPLFGTLRNAAALKRDMDLAYSLVIVALCGGVEPEQSRAAVGFAGTRAVDKIGRVFRLRPASRSAEHIGRPALSPLALSARELRSLYSNVRDRRKPAAIIVAPPWPNTGSSNVFAAQAAAHKQFGHEVLLVLGPLHVSSGGQQEISDVEIEMHYEGISSVISGLTSDTMQPYRSRSFLDWILAGRDDSLSIRARYAARNGWRAGILNFIDRNRVEVIHVNHAFEMLLGIRIREAVFRRTGKTPRLICDTHDVQAKAYAERGEENPFNGRKEKYTVLLNSELSLYRTADILTHCSKDDKEFFEVKLPNTRHILVTPCLDPQQEKALHRIRSHDYEKQFDFLYVGNNNFANFTAVKWLLTEVLPLLNGPPPRIALVGRIKELMRHMDKRLYEKYKHYFVGVVPDIGIYYSISNTVLAPSLVGTGCSVKLIEALCAGKTIIATADSLRGLPDHVRERCAEFVRNTPGQFAEAMMMTLGRRLGDNHKVGSIYDDYLHSKHYIARMNDLFTEILEAGENETNRSDVPSTTVRL
jgi:GT2 family glycosyltransferase/glycosyltransferase involved in cell wall biosynthesis